MKKLNFGIFALLLFAALSSCSSDSSGESNGTSTGDYFPLAVNNKWDFTNGTDASEINLIGTANFGGTTYYEMTDTDSGVDGQVWITKKGATYYQKAGDLTFVESGTTVVVKSFEIPMFKDDLNVNETWEGTRNTKVNYSGAAGSGSTTANIHYLGKITARDVSVTLGGITYNNVIKMDMTVTETVNSQTTTTSGENWFAKDIGLIYDSTVSDSGTESRYLTGYTLH